MKMQVEPRTLLAKMQVGAWWRCRWVQMLAKMQVGAWC